MEKAGTWSWDKAHFKTDKLHSLLKKKKKKDWDKLPVKKGTCLCQSYKNCYLKTAIRLRVPKCHFHPLFYFK